MPALDDNLNKRVNINECRRAVAVVPHNTNELANVTRFIYIGGAGDLKVTMIDSGTVTFSALPVGTLLPIRAKVVFSTGTTATNIISLF